MAENFVLVHGAWHGGWAWQPVATGCAPLGTGCGRRPAPGSASTTIREA